MSSIEALARLRRAAGKTGKALPVLSATARQARQLARQPIRPGFDLPPDLSERLQERLRQTQWIYSFRRLKRVEWRLAPLLLWQGEPPLITVFGMFDRVISRLEDDRSGIMARRLIQAWLAAYDDDMPKRDAAAAAIRRALAMPDRPALEPWRAAERDFGLFSPDCGPAGLARAALAAPGGWSEVASAARLTSRHAGFMAAFRRHAQALIGTEDLKSDGLPSDRLAPRPNSPGNEGQDP